MKNMMRMKTVILALVIALNSVPAQAGLVSRGVREVVEFAAKRFGREVAEEGVERLTSRVASLAAKHGDEVVSAAIRKVGPKAGRLASEAGEHSDVALRLLTRHGDQAVGLVQRKGSLQLISRFGDDGAEALLRHGMVGEKVIGQFAEGGAKALAKVSPQNGRRLVMLADEGLMKPQLMDIVSRHGERACEFIWEQKAPLAVAATMAAFIANPEPFLDGTVRLSEVVADAAVRPLVQETGRHFGGILTLLGLIVIAIVAVVFECSKPGRSPVKFAARLLLHGLRMRFFRGGGKK